MYSGFHVIFMTHGCLVKDGALISAVQEERFTGIKGDPSFPSRSIEWFEYNNISIKDIDYIIFYETFKKFLRILNFQLNTFLNQDNFLYHK